MKKSFFALMFLTLAFGGVAQNYDMEQLKVVSVIWGEAYLFHPAIVRADKNIEWEKQFVEFLPEIKNHLPADEFTRTINTGLLSALDDPFTIVQSYENKQTAPTDFKASKNFDYVRISEDQLSEIGSIEYLDSIIQDRSSDRALVVDLRISNELNLDRHSNTLFDYFSAMLISNEIEMSTLVTREHFGWDEYNDWWFYEQRWKVATHDKQIANSSRLMPLPSYLQELYPYLPDYNWDEYKPVERPVYFITNNSFRSYYNPELLALQTNRPNTFVINENSGKIFPDNPDFKQLSFSQFEFILNAAFSLNHGVPGLQPDLNEVSLTQDHVSEFVASTQSKTRIPGNFSLNISPAKYTSESESLSTEEKILGVVKIWTIVKYFYPFPEQISADWNSSLEKYLLLAQNTGSDKEYFTMIQEMMANLNDSHVSTFHPSILDFSEIFVAPVQFDWIENKVIVTAVDSSVKSDIMTGDEILAIDDLSIDEILKNETPKISHSNRQGLLANLINPGYFIGPMDSNMKFTILSNGKRKDVEVPRTMYVFQFIGYCDNRPASTVIDNEIGYLNLAAITTASDLENELLKMNDTRSLIIDLRSSYPSEDFEMFLRMLCQSEVAIRRSRVPIVSSSQGKAWQYEETTVSPVATFSYNKPIAVLVDKTMISRPEDIAIALRSFPNVRFVGEQTQGTDGEMTIIHLPGGGETSYTGEIVNFGNGDEFQRIGIIPDIEVHRTIKGVKEKRDEILEKAIEILKKK
ncbi:hypothetical protein SDC9_51350 [bioreactor metagenome]|uniref:Tail specific protease domain-containing protein n=1 Tax=bioreactor metagenome TaxID=1076179 RepID=A0A644WMC0_9ZZZZ